MRRLGLGFVALALLGSPLAAPADPTGYQSPYSLHYSFSLEQLTSDFSQSPRNDPKLESSLAPERWYDRAAFNRGDAPWGPKPAHFPAPSQTDPRWRQERVIATGQKYLGYAYQHHHIPDWDPSPYPGWPWLRVGCGHKGNGLDCSNFTAWCYNYGLGIALSGNVHTQAASALCTGPGGPGSIQLRRVASAAQAGSPPDYDELVACLEPGDLLYIRPNSRTDLGQVSHVIMWLGRVGHSPDGTPLVMDCHGAGISDCNGATIS